MLVGMICTDNVSVAVGTMCADDDLSITVAVEILGYIDDVGFPTFVQTLDN